MDAITATVTWQDLITGYDDELSDLRDAYTEITSLATEEYGDDWQDTPVPSDPGDVPDEKMELWTYQQQAQQYEQAAKSIQQRQHLLDTLSERFGDGEFEIKMLSGSETMDVEADLRMMAQQRDVDMDVIQIRRNALTVDAATVDAPEGVPRDDAGSPTPSECPNALTLALWERVQAFNNAGETDFQAAGFGNAGGQPIGGSSDPPSMSTPSSERSDLADTN